MRALLCLIVAAVSLCGQVEAARSCPATCSPHVTLPCSFGSLDRCIENTCRDLCWRDDYRKMISCYCRGSAEGPTLRSCFCGPSTHSAKPKKILF
uniref:DB domain-containing protein n=1 Tax=Ascaris lumbricoides TaxID=6252 RepID=A0A0M3I4S2_ASCLU